ncbi:MAG: GDP-mannose 4,6-dehydratase [Nanoarchaeota archaeon]|nr:GDP-mannose 4,6-dehydratase [Nanoarchaeota archaeon]
MKALITGAGGFVGGYLKKHLEEKNIEVAGLDKHPNVNTTHTVDLLDKEKLSATIKEVSPDLIFHLAAQSSVKKSWQEPELTKEINVQGTKNLLDAVKENNLNPKILLISSADVYGIPATQPMNESLPLAPVSPYGKSRIEQEKLALSYDLDIIISRSFTHTGPGQKAIFVCSDFVKQVAEIEKGTRTELVTGDLTITRDIIDVRDMVTAYLIAIQKAKPKQIYNLCGNKGYKLQEIVDILRTLTTTEITVKQDPEKIRTKDIPEMIGDNTKFTQTTNWKPKIPMQQTLKDMLDFWRKEL